MTPEVAIRVLGLAENPSSKALRSARDKQLEALSSIANANSDISKRLVALTNEAFDLLNVPKKTLKLFDFMPSELVIHPQGPVRAVEGKLPIRRESVSEQIAVALWDGMEVQFDNTAYGLAGRDCFILSLTLANPTSSRVESLFVNRAVLIDDQDNQYEPEIEFFRTMPGDRSSQVHGSVLAPRAPQSGFLVYPSLRDGATLFKRWYWGTSAIIENAVVDFAVDIRLPGTKESDRPAKVGRRNKHQDLAKQARHLSRANTRHLLFVSEQELVVVRHNPTLRVESIDPRSLQTVRRLQQRIDEGRLLKLELVKAWDKVEVPTRVNISSICASGNGRYLAVSHSPNSTTRASAATILDLLTGQTKSILDRPSLKKYLLGYDDDDDPEEWEIELTADQSDDVNALLESDAASVALSNDGAAAIEIFTAEGAFLWDVERGIVVDDLGRSSMTFVAEAAAFLPNDARILVASDMGEVSLWSPGSIPSTESLVDLGYASGDVNRLIVSARGDFALVCTDQGAIISIELRTGRATRLTQFETRREFGQPIGIAPLPYGTHVVVGEGNSLQLLDMSTAEEIRTFEGHKGSIICCAVSPSGKIAATADSETIRLWSLS